MKTSDILIELIPSFEGQVGEYRTISDRILSGKIKVPADQVKSADAWKKLQTHCTNPADIRAIDADIIKKHPLSPALLESAYAWLHATGLPDISDSVAASGALCKAALCHHDISGFGDNILCIVWLEKSAGLELVFPQLARRIPLHLGTIVVFDAGQPHAVLHAGDEVFEPMRYLELPSQAFLAIDFKATTLGLSAFLDFSVYESAEGWPGPLVLVDQNGPDVDAVTGVWLERGDYERPAKPVC